MPVDYYNLHPYAGADIMKFKEIIIDFRKMMRQLGEQDKPLILTEFGVLNETLPQREVINLSLTPHFRTS